MNSSAPIAELQNLAEVLEPLGQALNRHGELGLLSVTVLRRSPGMDCEGWEDYEEILSEINLFLSGFSRHELRSTDIVLEPVVAGNTLVIVLGPPRDDRSLSRGDLGPVRQRLSRGIQKHLDASVADHVLERYGVYVGCSTMRHDVSVDCERIVYRGLEESFVDALSQRTREGMRQAVQLQRVLRNGTVNSVYQPVVDVVDRRVIGFEALTRLPAGEFRNPEVLFKVAHENGALWALERLCRRTALQGLPRLEGDQKLFLNVEPDSFHDPDLRRAEFLDPPSESGLQPSQIVLEITEHAAVKDFRSMRRVLDEVRERGFQLAMDDVGSGYANLQAIAEIRPDYLKVDMSLVRDMHRDPMKRALVATIHHFATTTDITLVAEGVECLAELESLVEVGVRCAQGYLFARPDAPPDSPDWKRLLG